jgi:hypothetical protein
MTDTVIVDVDGTLAEFDPASVADWVLGDTKQWTPFFQHMAKAPAIDAICRLVRMLKAQGQIIVICSGRPASHSSETEAWLIRNEVPFDALYLRVEGDDAVSDDDVKARLLAQMRADGFDPWLVLDDRSAVVARWRALGLTCLQCAPGDF